MVDTAANTQTVLLVDDDEDLLIALRRVLATEGYEVRTAIDGESGLRAALDEEPGLVILDIGLPLRSGVDVARELRTRGFRAPVLMLTARSAVSDRVSGLDAGADDYLPKPFENAELLARVKALLRRAALSASAAPIRVRDITVDPLTRRVQRGGVDVDLTQREYALLEYLLRNRGRIVTRQEVGDRVWKRPLDSDTNVVDVYIKYLREKLGDDKKEPLIRTVRGAGYEVVG